MRTTNPKRPPSPLWGGEGGGGHALSQGLAVNRIQNQLHHPFQIPGDIRIPEPQHLKTLRGQPFIPPLVALATMPAAVNLDHQPPP
jgi:hypothetical protein